MHALTRYFQSLSARTIAVVSLLVIIAVVVFIGLPAVRELQKQKQTLTQMRETLERKHEEGQSLPEILQLYERYRPYRTELAGAVMPTGRRVEFITLIEQTAETSGVELTLSADAYRPLKDTSLSVLPLQLTVTGSFQQTVQFLAQLERLPQYLTVDHLAMHASQAPVEGAFNPLTTTIQITSYWQN